MKREYFDRVRCVMSGAAPLGAEDEERFLKKINKPIQISQGKSFTYMKSSNLILLRLYSTTLLPFIVSHLRFPPSSFSFPHA